MKDKKGNKITIEEFFTRWGQGIKNVASNPTPIEKLTIEIRGTFINLIGLITCLIALLIFQEKFFVNWFAYGLMLIFTGNIITTGLKFFGIKEQLKRLKEFEVSIKGNDKKGMGSMKVDLDKIFEEIK